MSACYKMIFSEQLRSGLVAVMNHSLRELHTSSRGITPSPLTWTEFCRGMEETGIEGESFWRAVKVEQSEETIRAAILKKGGMKLFLRGGCCRHDTRSLGTGLNGLRYLQKDDKTPSKAEMHLGSLSNVPVNFLGKMQRKAIC